MITAQELLFRGPCVRKLLTGLIMYIYPLKIKNIVLYCIVFEIMALIGISRKNKTKNVYLLKIRLLVQIGEDI